MDSTLDTIFRNSRQAPHTFIIAEAGVNHNGCLETAKALIDVAVASGADAVKFQTFNAKRLVTRNAPKAGYQVRQDKPTESQLDMLEQLSLSDSDHDALFSYCRKKGICFLSSPFDEQSADFLDVLGVDAFKIGSGEITNFPFLKHVAQKRKPIILSTGMSILKEVDDAVHTIRSAGNDRLILLHCVSCYPAQPADANLRAMQTMFNEFYLPVGYSDHTQGIEIALAAVALGASIIEKHFTLDKYQNGPDHRASLNPSELAELVKAIRTVEISLGHGRKEPAAGEMETLQVARKSLVAARDIQAGTLLTQDMINIKRPGTGIKPAMYNHLAGRKLKKSVTEGDLFTWEMLA